MKENIFKELRLKAGLSQGQVAKKLGYTSPQFVSNWERGKSAPPPESIKKIAKIYNCEDLENICIDLMVQDYRAKILRKFARA